VGDGTTVHVGGGGLHYGHVLTGDTDCNIEAEVVVLRR